MINLCYHPTTAIFIDDDDSFLEFIRRKLAKKNSCLFYKSPDEALSFMNNDYHYEPFIKSCINEEEEADFDQVIFSCNLRSIRDEVLRENRFSEVSVVVVDYNMPQMNGLEFCQRIKNPHVLKVLLTGEGDANLAVEAFNKGIIDKFILKSAPDLFAELEKIIAELGQQYFLNLSSTIKNKINITQNVFFDDVVSSMDIAEYYMLDESGGFLVVDTQGLAYVVVIKSEEDIEGDYEYAEMEGAPEEVLLPLKSKEKLLYIVDEKNLQTPPSGWAPHLHETRKIAGENPYYYSIITETEKLIKQKIKSFREFMTDH